MKKLRRKGTFSSSQQSPQLIPRTTTAVSGATAVKRTNAVVQQGLDQQPMDEIDSQGAGGQGFGCPLKSFSGVAGQQQETDSPGKEQGKGVTVVVEHRVEHRLTDLASRHGEQRQKPTAEKDHGCSRPAVFGQLLEVVAEVSAQRQIRQGVPVVTAKVVHIPEELPGAGVAGTAQQPAEQIFQIVEKQVAKGQQKQQTKAIAVDLLGAAAEPLEHRHQQGQKQKGGKVPQVLNVSHGEGFCNLQKLPGGAMLSAQDQDDQKGDCRPAHRENGQMDAAPYVFSEIHRAAKGQGAAGGEKQRHTDAHQGAQPIDQNGEEPTGEHIRGVAKGEVVEHHQV